MIILIKDLKYFITIFFSSAFVNDDFVFELGFINNITFCNFYSYYVSFVLIKTKLTHHKLYQLVCFSSHNFIPFWPSFNFLGLVCNFQFTMLRVFGKFLWVLSNIFMVREGRLPHDVVWDAFVFITKMWDFMCMEQIHILPLPTFEFVSKGRHYGFGEWCSNVTLHHLIRFGFTHSSILLGCCYSCNWS